VHHLFHSLKYIFNIKDIWNYIRVPAMTLAVFARITQDMEVKELLSATDDFTIIYEEDDIFWGIGKDGTGSNTMGKILQGVRDCWRSYANVENSVIMKMQIAKFEANIKLARLQNEDNEKKGFIHLKRVNMEEKEKSKIKDVINYGVMEKYECRHENTDYNRLMEDIGYDKIPKFEYVHCPECLMDCIVEREEWNI
jgi:hypothetical protein